MWRKTVFGAIISAFLLLGCDNGISPDNKDGDNQVRDLSPAEQKIVEAGKSFGVKLFRKINESQPDSNVFISPLSVSMALGMTMNGADGATYEAMKQTLEFNGLTEAEINQAYKDLMTLLPGMDEKVLFEIANSIWYRNTFPVRETFLETNRDYFDAEVNAMDFNDPAVVDIINDWVSDKTHEKIKTIIDNIDPMTVMFLINAIYFKGTWTYEFDPEKTADDIFKKSPSEEIPCRMMKIGGNFEYYQDEEIQIVDLPYGDGHYSMTILLPAQDVGVDEFIESLDQEKWEWYLQALEIDSGMVRMPKYKLEYNLIMNDVLKSLGMEVAFKPGEADFSRISSEPELYISQVRHKSFIQTDEEGTEAAAVTIVELKVIWADPGPEYFYMRIDRPFVFIIHEHSTNAILFMGKIVNPEWTE
jgi:serpin B